RRSASRIAGTVRLPARSSATTAPSTVARRAAARITACFALAAPAATINRCALQVTLAMAQVAAGAADLSTAVTATRAPTMSAIRREAASTPSAHRLAMTRHLAEPLATGATVSLFRIAPLRWRVAHPAMWPTTESVLSKAARRVGGSALGGLRQKD